MSRELDKAMTPLSDASQALADRVAETLMLFHDFEPISPTKKKIAHDIEMSRLAKNKRTEYSIKDERDISMLTNTPRSMSLVVAYAKSLDVVEPCEARTAFVEQMLRSCRSEKGWGLEKAIEAMKAVRPMSDTEKEKGRIGRLMDWFKTR